MPRLVPKHPLPIRVLHWLNFPTLFVMIWSGLLIYWAYDPYQISVGGVVLVKFFPDWFYRALDLRQGLATGMAYHFLFAWLFAGTGVLYVLATLWTGEWRELVPDRRTPREAWRVVLHDLHLRNAPLPPMKFNGAQRLAYTGVVVMGAGSVVTGLAILKPTQLWWLTAALGGYQTARLIHFALTLLYLVFFVAHVGQVAKAGWNNFRSMVTGYEVAPGGPEPPMTEPQSPPPPPPPAAPPADPADVPAADIRRRTRRAFAVSGAAAAAAGGAWWWLRSRSADGGVVWPLRRVHRLNEGVGRALFSPARLAPEFPARAAAEPKTNGHYGEPAAAPAGGWKVRIEVPGKPPAEVAPADLLAGLPRAETVTELKCIEGWSVVVRWGGVRFADVAAARGWPVADFPYVAMSTPDDGYYVGLDVSSLLHPQTLLCDRMNGEPLTAGHGAPLRLTLPVKYGIKNIKWVGRIAFATERPADYWAEQGYDWYAGL